MQNTSSLKSESNDIRLHPVLDAVDFNDEHLANSDVAPVKKPAHTVEKSQKRNAQSELETLQRTLVERKILLCNLQIDIARKQLEAMEKPPPQPANS